MHVRGQDIQEKEVRLREEDVTETYDVAPDAEIFTYTGTLRHPQSFSDFRVGEQVMLEFDAIEGDATLAEVASTESMS